MTNATTVPGGLEARKPAGSAAGASANGSTVQQ